MSTSPCGRGEFGPCPFTPKARIVNSMARRSFSRTNPYERYIPFGLFGGQISGVLFLLLAFILVLVSAARPGMVDAPRRVVQATVAPVIAPLSLPFVSLAEGIDYLFSLTRLNAEVAQLRLENKRLDEWYNKAQLLQAENQSLRDLLKVKLEPGLDFKTARVVADTGGPYAQTILINVGARDDIRKGDAVLAGEGLIGRVTDVLDDTSEVLLMTDLNSRIPVRVEGSNIQAILIGTNTQQLWLTRLPEGTVLNNDQRVMTSGIGGVFPPDLPVGRARVLENKRVTLAPYADFGRLMYVRVVKMPRTSLRTPSIPGGRE
jgi:rod shape-determining protein MreC